MSPEATVDIIPMQMSDLQKAVFPGAGYDGITEYKSVIYYQVKQPCWNETVKVSSALLFITGGCFGL